MISETHKIDCIKFMKQFPDKFFDLAPVDPVYGIDGNSHRNNKSRSKKTRATDYPSQLWNQEKTGQDYFDELFRVSKHQIIWGINYFVGCRDLKIGGGRIVWDKVNGSNSFSDCEIAYCSLIESVRLFRFMWNGMMQGKSMSEGHLMNPYKSLNEKRIHPTQKPVVLYKWCFKKFAQPGWKILDTHLGSGSSRIAAHDMGFDFYGCEVVDKYFEDQEERFKNHISQLSFPFVQSQKVISYETV